MPRHVLFTDLDDCLLDCDSSSFDQARSALGFFRSARTPVILVSGKTRAEIEPLRERLDHHDPFIVENGAAVYVPLETFDFTPESLALLRPGDREPDCPDLYSSEKDVAG